MKVAVLTIAALMGVPASAQNSTMTCFRSGQYVNCSTSTTPSAPTDPSDFLGPMHILPDPNAFQEGQQQAERLRQQQLQNQISAQNLAEQQRQSSELSERNRLEAIRSAQAIRVEAEHEATRKDAMQHVINGDCAGAINVALTAGDLDLATKTKAFCASPDAPKKRGD